MRISMVLNTLMPSLLLLGLSGCAKGLVPGVSRLALGAPVPQSCQQVGIVEATATKESRAERKLSEAAREEFAADAIQMQEPRIEDFIGGVVAYNWRAVAYRCD